MNTRIVLAVWPGPGLLNFVAQYQLGGPAWLEVLGSNWSLYQNGVRRCTLAKATNPRARIVLFDVLADATEDAFQGHVHPGGEVFIVVDGEVYDEFGTYPKGSLVLMGAGSRHAPRTRGRTVIIVVWIDGIEEDPTVASYR